MSTLLLLAVWSLVVYRIGRFIILDTMIDKTRVRFVQFLRRHPNWLANKVYQLLGCPFCVTVWVAAGVLAAHRIFVGPFPMPVWMWLGAASGSLIVWRIVDYDDSDSGEDEG